MVAYQRLFYVSNGLRDDVRTLLLQPTGINFLCLLGNPADVVSRDPTALAIILAGVSAVSSSQMENSRISNFELDSELNNSRFCSASGVLE